MNLSRKQDLVLEWATLPQTSMFMHTCGFHLYVYRHMPFAGTSMPRIQKSSLGDVRPSFCLRRSAAASFEFFFVSLAQRRPRWYSGSLCLGLWVGLVVWTWI